MDNMDFETYIRKVDDGLDFYSDSIKQINGLLLTNKEINVLDNYEIPYMTCNNLKEIIYLIEDKILEFDSPEELIEISESISERDYYENTNK